MTGGLGLVNGFDIVVVVLELVVVLVLVLLSEVVGGDIIGVEVEESDAGALTEEPEVGVTWLAVPVSSGPTPTPICRLAGRVG